MDPSLRTYTSSLLRYSTNADADADVDVDVHVDTDAGVAFGRPGVHC